MYSVNILCCICSIFFIILYSFVIYIIINSATSEMDFRSEKLARTFFHTKKIFEQNMQEIINWSDSFWKVLKYLNKSFLYLYSKAIIKLGLHKVNMITKKTKYESDDW